MKISQAILFLYNLKKKHGDVDIGVLDDNNGGVGEFNAYFDDDKDVYFDKYASDNRGGKFSHKHQGTKRVIVCSGES